MSIVLVGLNYHTASLDFRERLYLTGDNLRSALAALHDGSLSEVVIVSTCNRLEIYANSSDVDQAEKQICNYLVSIAGQPVQQVVQTQLDDQTVHHLMRVACGLESLLLGETEILGQIAESLESAQHMQTTGAVLSRLFQDAIHTGKRARTETSISKHGLSISHVAVLMAKRHFADLRHINVLVIGAGRMAELAIKALKAQEVTTIRVTNRTFARADVVARRSGVESLEWQHLETALSEADMVITATSSPNPILNAAVISAARNILSVRPVLLIDIAVPRNVHQDVHALPYVRLYDIDDLRQIVDDHRARRGAEISRVEAIVADQVEIFKGWLKSRKAVPTIITLRQKAEAVADAELTRTLHRLPDLSDHEREVIEQMAQRIVNKLLHAPTASLLERAAQGDHFTYVHAVQQLFHLENESDRD